MELLTNNVTYTIRLLRLDFLLDIQWNSFSPISLAVNLIFKLDAKLKIKDPVWPSDNNK